MDDVSEEQLRKRRRVLVACDHCRRRKMRCDGVQPLCSYCRSHDIACVYQKAHQKVQVSQHYLHSLLRRVGELQQTNASLAQQAHGHLYCAPEQEIMVSNASQMTISECVPESPFDSGLPKLKAGFDPQNADPAPEEADFVTDAMVCAGSPAAPGGDYFGNSSTLAFLEVLEAMAVRNGTELARAINPAYTRRSGDLPGRPSMGRPSMSIPRTLSIQSRFLPPRATADHLIETYFSRVSDLYTVLHEPTFREEYERVWLPGSQPDELWFCILNVVFALGSLFSELLPPEDGESTARTFFVQAKELFNFDNLDCSSLAVVQALLLMGQYLQSTKQANRCWCVFGLAIRISQGLGLQLNDLNNKCAPLEREMRKRCWCGCLVMDTMVAMTFGRPMMIPPEHYDVEMPQPVDDARITTSHIAPQPKDSEQPKILLFIYKVKLCMVLHNILRAMYQVGNGTENKTLLGGEMMQFDQQLCDWQASLPPSLRMGDFVDDDRNPEDMPNARPRNVLYTRYLTVRILLTRPSLAVVARMAHQGGKLRPLGHAFALSAAGACIDTSKRLIDHIRSNVMRERKFLGASWYNTHSVFSAGLVLFASQTIPELRPQVADGVHWNDCIEAVRALSRKCSSARACLSMLELLDKHLKQSHDKTQRAPQQAGFEGLHTGLSDWDNMSPSALHDWMDIIGIDDLLSKDSPVFESR